MNPIVAVILGALDPRRSPIDARTLVAGAVIVVAVALIVTPVAGCSDRAAVEADRGSGHASARIVRVTRRASAMIVIIGLTPMPVGNSEPSRDVEARR